MSKKIIVMIGLFFISISAIMGFTASIGKADLRDLVNRRNYGSIYYNEETGYVVDMLNEKKCVIPQKIEGVIIKGIATRAFALAYDLEKIYIPNTVIDIVDDAFGSVNPMIYCIQGSYAEKWAKKHNFRCTYITEEEYQKAWQEQEKNSKETKSNKSNKDFWTDSPYTKKDQSYENTEINVTNINEIAKNVKINDKSISNIKVGTINENIKNWNINENYDVKVYSKEGKEVDKNAKIATGMKIGFYDKKDNLLYQYTAVVKGDTTGDGEVSIDDAKSIIKNKLGKEKFENIEMQNAGNIVSTENVPNAIDALAIIKSK